MDQPSFEGLLHVGALAVVICAGYLGIDRIRSERQTLVAEINAVQKYVRTKIDALNLPAEQHVEIPKPYRIHAMYVLCYVAKVRLANIPKRSRIASFFCRIWYVPLLRYFHSGADRIVIGALCLISFILFEFTIYAGIAQHSWLLSFYPLLTVFCIYTAILLWVFITASLSLRLRNLGSVCMVLKGKLIKEIEDTLAVDLQRALTDLGEPLPPTEPPASPATQFVDEDD
jgi:hypothetical protein